LACQARRQSGAERDVRRGALLFQKEYIMNTENVAYIAMREIEKITAKYPNRGITSKLDRDLFDAWYNVLYLVTEGITLREVEEEINTNMRYKKLKNALKKSNNSFISAVQ
jgi:hypothetical protein